MQSHSKNTVCDSTASTIVIGKFRWPKLYYNVEKPNVGTPVYQPQLKIEIPRLFSSIFYHRIISTLFVIKDTYYIIKNIYTFSKMSKLSQKVLLYWKLCVIIITESKPIHWTKYILNLRGFFFWFFSKTYECYTKIFLFHLIHRTIIIISC